MWAGLRRSGFCGAKASSRHFFCHIPHMAAMVRPEIAAFFLIAVCGFVPCSSQATNEGMPSCRGIFDLYFVLDKSVE